jgi:peptide chain release factor 1
VVVQDEKNSWGKLDKRLKEIEEEYQQLSEALADPKNITNPAFLKSSGKRLSELEAIVGKYNELKGIQREIRDLKEMDDSELDQEMKKLIADELRELREKREKAEEALGRLLAPKADVLEKNVIMEIRAGTGGDESTLFAAELFRMYERYIMKKHWKMEVIDFHPTEAGGFKEIIFAVEGRGVFQRLRFESGTHRVQRVPVTESSGRIHTSAVTVAVLPEVEDVEVEIDPRDIRVDVFRSSGPGGQSVNTTDSAVRITHLPTGITVSCQDEKSQHKNKQKAMRVLRARLFEKYQEEQRQERSNERRKQIGTGDRSEKIRTYNFPQNRVTDHRISLTLYRLELILQGELDEIIDRLLERNRLEALKKVS